MSHGIERMAYVGEKPWHQLGSELSPNQPIEVWAKEAGLDWNILTSKIEYLVPTIMETMEYPGQVVLYRGDNSLPLSIVSDGYKIVQPIEVLEFFRDLVSDMGFELETAGCLFEGRKFWALAKTGKESYIQYAADKIRGRLLLASSCDGTMATTAQFVSERVVCNNTLQIALKESGGKVVTRHKTVFDANTVKSKLGLIDEAWRKFIDDCNAMANVPITKQSVKQFLVAAFDGDMEKPFEEQANKRAMQRVYELAKDSPGSELSEGTVWSLVNGLTRFVDFERRAGTIDNRLNNAWFGLGAGIKEKGFQAAKEIAGIFD